MVNSMLSQMPYSTTFLAVASLMIVVTEANGDQEVQFSLMVSSAPTLDTTGVVYEVDQALELINNDTAILSEHDLHYSNVLDAQCTSLKALELFNMSITSNESVVAIVGCGCSLATEEVARRSDIPVISYASTSAALSDRSVYPNLFRTVPSDESLAPALATVMQYYGWRTISILTEQQTQFIQLLQYLDTSLSLAGISIETSVQFNTGNLSEAADMIFKGDSRIILLNTSPKSALFHLCRTFLGRRYYPGYVWITPGWYQQGWWKIDKDYLQGLNSYCTFSNIKQQLSRSLVLLAHPNTSSLNITEPYNSSSYAMDAVMTLALALNKTLENPSLNLSLRTAIEDTMFSGASGIIQFDSNGNRLSPVVLLQQFRMDSNGSIHLYSIARIMKNTVEYINGETNSSLWPDPTGFPPLITIITDIRTPVRAYVIVVITIGVILSLACLVFNIIFRKRKVVKLTSPNLNYVIVLGALMLMIGNFDLLIPSENITVIAISCTMARGILNIGYDICFVVALVKTVRVAYIFKFVTPNKKKVHDWHLLLLSAGIIMIEVIFTIPPFTLIFLNGDAAMLIRDNESPTYTNMDGYTVTYRIISCARESSTFIVYFSLALVYKIIIHVIGLVLAFITRKVKIDPLNDSRYSAAIIYSSCVVLVLATIVIFTSTLFSVNVFAGVWTTLILVEVCIFLGLTFIPKMVSLHRDPKGAKIFEGTESQAQNYHASSISTTISTTHDH